MRLRHWLGTCLGLGVALWPAGQACGQAEYVPGSIVLANGDTAHGMVSLSLADDLLQFVENQAVHTLTARQVALLRLGEPPRLYTTHAAALRGNLEVPAFFEVLAPGPYATLLSRDKMLPSGGPVYDPYGQPIPGTFGQPRIKRDFFWLDRRGHVRRVPIRTRELARILEQNNTPTVEVSRYIKEHKVIPSMEEDLTALTQFYNQLKSTQWQQQQQQQQLQNQSSLTSPQGP